MRHVIARLFLVSLLGINAAWAEPPNPQTPLSFGVFPYLPPAQLEQLYAPVAADLSRAIGRPVQLRTRPDFRSFSEEVKRQNYDLIFIQPFAYARLARHGGYRALARPRMPLSAIFVTREGSDIDSLDDLRGKDIATPPQRAAVSILGLQMLLNHGLRPGNNIHLTYQNSHVACMRMALIGKASACITAPSPLSVFTRNSGIQFDVIATSDSVPASTFAVHTRVAPATQDRLLKQMLDWDKHASGRKLLNALHHTPFIISHDEDYDPVRSILDNTEAFRESPTRHEPYKH